jgi:hypothetical protein
MRRHLLMLNRLLQHTMGGAKHDLDLVMPTLSPDPRYIAYSAITTPDFFTKVESSQVPQTYRDYVDAR